MDKHTKIERIWKYLNEEGIFTVDELNERIQAMPKINIAPFVSPIKEEGLNVGCDMQYNC